MQRERDGSSKAIHQTADRAAFLSHGDEQLAGTAVGIQANIQVAFMAADVELVRNRLTRIRQAFAAWFVDDLSTAFSAALSPSVLVDNG